MGQSTWLVADKKSDKAALVLPPAECQADCSNLRIKLDERLKVVLEDSTPIIEFSPPVPAIPAS